MATITTEQYNASKQKSRNLHIRINLLDYSRQIVDSVEGRVIGGNINLDANSNIRSTCSIEMVVDETYIPTVGGKIWLDRLVQIYIGVENISTTDIVWTNMGIFLINNPSYQYDAESNTLSFQGVDMMSLFTGMRNGYLTEAYVIPEGVNVRDVIIAILQSNDFSDYVVAECTDSIGNIQPVPYDMTYEAGATWWDVLDGLLQIMPTYQMYFDVNGVFHYDTVPYSRETPVRITDDIWENNVLSETVAYDFESVKNSIKVLGRTHTVQYFSEGTVGENGVITLNVPETIENSTMVGFILSENATAPTAYPLSILRQGDEASSAKYVYKDDDTAVTSLTKDEYWVIRYDSAATCWRFLGHLQAIGEAEEDNPKSPFFVGNTTGRINLVLYGGEYDNIMTDDLAVERAQWEIYQRCRLNDSISITSIPIYWAEVNWMISYTPLGQTVVNQYLIKSISTDLSADGTQTYELTRWYPYYIQNIKTGGVGRIVVGTMAGGDTANVVAPHVIGNVGVSSVCLGLTDAASNIVGKRGLFHQRAGAIAKGLKIGAAIKNLIGYFAQSILETAVNIACRLNVLRNVSNPTVDDAKVAHSNTNVVVKDKAFGISDDLGYRHSFSDNSLKSKLFGVAGESVLRKTKSKASPKILSFTLSDSLGYSLTQKDAMHDRPSAFSDDAMCSDVANNTSILSIARSMPENVVVVGATYSVSPSNIARITVDDWHPPIQTGSTLYIRQSVEVTQDNNEITIN